MSLVFFHFQKILYRFLQNLSANLVKVGRWTRMLCDFWPGAILLVRRAQFGIDMVSSSARLLLNLCTISFLYFLPPRLMDACRISPVLTFHPQVPITIFYVGIKLFKDRQVFLGSENDVPWEGKKNEMIWRGSSTGGSVFGLNVDFWNFHRHRFETQNITWTFLISLDLLPWRMLSTTEYLKEVTPIWFV